jgi:hypothetical protein
MDRTSFVQAQCTAPLVFGCFKRPVFDDPPHRISVEGFFARLIAISINQPKNQVDQSNQLD